MLSLSLRMAARACFTHTRLLSEPGGCGCRGSRLGSPALRPVFCECDSATHLPALLSDVVDCFGCGETESEQHPHTARRRRGLAAARYGCRQAPGHSTSQQLTHSRPSCCTMNSYDDAASASASTSTSTLPPARPPKRLSAYKAAPRQFGSAAPSCARCDKVGNDGTECHTTSG